MDRRPAKVLIVEDHPDLLQFLDLVLTKHGWDVITSSNRQEALNKLKYTSPSLILLDMWMPGMDGFELARFLKRCSHYRDIPILAVTGLAGFDSRELCLEAGCDDYIAKPFTLTDLQDRITRLLSRHGPGTESAHRNEDESCRGIKKS